MTKCIRIKLDRLLIFLYKHLIWRYIDKPEGRGIKVWGPKIILLQYLYSCYWLYFVWILKPFMVHYTYILEWNMIFSILIYLSIIVDKHSRYILCQIMVMSKLLNNRQIAAFNYSILSFKVLKFCQLNSFGMFYYIYWPSVRWMSAQTNSDFINLIFDSVEML